MQVKSVWLRTKQIPGNSAHCTNVRRTNFNINFRINDKEKRCMPIIALNLHADYFISKIFFKHFSSMKIVTYQTILSGKYGNLIGQFPQNASRAKAWRMEKHLAGNTNTLNYCCSNNRMIC